MVFLEKFNISSSTRYDIRNVSMECFTKLGICVSSVYNNDNNNNVADVVARKPAKRKGLNQCQASSVPISY